MFSQNTLLKMLYIHSDRMSGDRHQTASLASTEPGTFGNLWNLPRGGQRIATRRTGTINDAWHLASKRIASTKPSSFKDARHLPRKRRHATLWVDAFVVVSNQLQVGTLIRLFQRSELTHSQIRAS
jgi:hypothetical protein